MVDSYRGPADGRRRSWRYTALALGGVSLLYVPAQRFRIDRLSCADWPSRSMNVAYWSCYLLALALLTVAWFGVVRAIEGKPLFGGGLTSDRRRHDDVDDLSSPAPSLSLVLLQGALLHLCALGIWPFLSNDPLCYAAIGHAMADLGKSPYVPLAEALPQTDLFLSHLPMPWHHLGSVYSPGFNAVAAAIAHLSGAQLQLHLKLYQVLGLMSVLLCAWLAGYTTQAAALRRDQGFDLLRHPSPVGPRPALEAAARREGARAAALLLFCPLAIIEGTIGGHNDVLLMLATALFALCVVRRRLWLAGLVLASGLWVKTSAVLLFGLYVLQLGVLRLFARVWRRGAPFRVLCYAGALLIGVLLLWLLWPVLQHYSKTTVRVIGSPADTAEFCTRSLECMPRIFLRHIVHAPWAAWTVGMLFRVAGGLFMLYVASRSTRSRYLPWAATYLFIYYLYLHSYSQAWYLLPLLPLLPYAPARLLPAMRTLCVSLLAYYAVDIPVDCDLPQWIIVAAEVLEGAIVVIPPTLMLLYDGRD